MNPEFELPDDAFADDEAVAPKLEGPARVVCVDDEARILRALKALLRDHNVHTTTDPADALRIAREIDADVLICDQRMPQMPGIEVLRQFKRGSPRTMRILLTGYSDLSAVLGSVNEGEVFRFVNKPWDNLELRGLVAQAAEIARNAPPEPLAEVSEVEREEARRTAGVLVIDDNPETQKRLREILSPMYQVRFAATPERALEILEQHETGVVISETETRGGDLTALLKALKRHHPHIPTVIITERANAQTAIELINEGQVYRFLLKPIRLGTTKLSIDSAISRYWTLKQNPVVARRYVVQDIPGQGGSLSALSSALLQRIRTLPSRLLGFSRAPAF